MGTGKNRRNRKRQEKSQIVSQNLVYVYNIDGVKNESCAKVKFVGQIQIGEADKVQDTLLKTFQLKDDVKAYVFLCNMTDSYLVSTRKYPYMYVIIDYYKSLLRCSLFKLYLYFTVTGQVQNDKQLINNKLDGEFTFEVCINDCYKKIDTSIPIFLGKDKTVDRIEELLKSPSIDTVINELMDDAEETRKNQYVDMFSNVSIPQVTVSLKDYESD